MSRASAGSYGESVMDERISGAFWPLEDENPLSNDELADLLWLDTTKLEREAVRCAQGDEVFVYHGHKFRPLLQDGEWVWRYLGNEQT